MKTEEVKPRSRLKREAMQEKSKWRKRLLQDPTPIDGQPLPDPSEGWVADRPKPDPTLCVSAVKVIRMSDGTQKKFYRMSVPVDEVKQMKKRAKKAARRIKKEDQAAAKKEARRAARAVLFMLGKQL